MIINTGQRTDIPAFYAKWFANRLREGYVYVRNPYNEKQVNKYVLNPSVVDVIGFCSKNPAPMFEYMDLLKSYGQYWFITITPYARDIEPNVPDKHKIIEDFMLIANETIAEDYYWQEIPFEFRVHEKPDSEKFNRLKNIIEKFGYYFKTSKESIHPKEVQKLLDKIEGVEEENFISRMILRSMQQARYSTECSGHFGLAARYYCHFTSPIRRYPDLQIHRIIKENLHGRLTENRIEHYNKILTSVAELNSKMERRAEEAEREVEKLKKVQYMTKHIGEVYEGIISGVTGYGVYVELPNTVEGMVRMASIPDDYYIYDEDNMLVFGKNIGNTYQLGQKVYVRVVMTDRKLLTIDFEFADGLD